MPMPTTVSTCAVETVQGKHVFRIIGYRKHRDMGGRKFVKSGIFSVGGRSWSVALSLVGLNSETDTNGILVGLLLLETGSSKVTRASYEINLVDQSSGMPVLVHKEAPRTFEPADQNNVSRSFLADYLKVKERSVFEAPRYLRDDCLTMEVIVTVLIDQAAPKTRSLPKIEVPPSNIAEHFGKLFESKEGVDITFIVGGETFTGHKIVLATRSPVFKAQLYGPFRKKGTEPITIDDLQPSVFGALLHFIYTDSLPAMYDLEEDDRCEMIHHLLVAADRYAIERLKLMCQSILLENLHVQTVATTLALADQHQCDKLKDGCIEFITCSNAMAAVAATQGYNNLKRSCPSVVIEILERSSRIRKA
jgi:speckle-type POZ protein